MSKQNREAGNVSECEEEFQDLKLLKQINDCKIETVPKVGNIDNNTELLEPTNDVLNNAMCSSEYDTNETRLKTDEIPKQVTAAEVIGTDKQVPKHDSTDNKLSLSYSAYPIDSDEDGDCTITVRDNDSCSLRRSFKGDRHNMEIIQCNAFHMLCPESKDIINEKASRRVNHNFDPRLNQALQRFRRIHRKEAKLNDKDTDPKESDCHFLREITWLPFDQLPVPNLEYTVALVNSPAEKIMERIANGERVGAHESMRFEILRVCTYRNYPGEDKPFRILLASAGWYFASDGDEVVCYCCGLRKSGWKEIDNPMEIHKQLRPSCDYLVRNSHVNVPIPELPAENAAKFRIFESNTSDSMPTGQSRQSEEASNSDSDNPQYRFFTPPPKHPQYAQLSARLDSFRKWPTNIPQTAQIMADCGYYYAGMIFLATLIKLKIEE